MYFLVIMVCSLWNNAGDKCEISENAGFLTKDSLISMIMRRVCHIMSRKDGKNVEDDDHSNHT